MPFPIHTELFAEGSFNSAKLEAVQAVPCVVSAANHSTGMTFILPSKPADIRENAKWEVMRLLYANDEDEYDDRQAAAQANADKVAVSRLLYEEGISPRVLKEVV